MANEITRSGGGELARADDPELSAETLIQVINNDLNRLTGPQRVEYYVARCRAAGLKPAANPFQFLSLQGKVVLYPKAECAYQLAEIHNLSVETISAVEDTTGGIYSVRVRVKNPKNRALEASAHVTIRDQRGGNLVGEALCNARMKAETKAMRRGVLMFCGLGGTDQDDFPTGAAELDSDGNTHVAETALRSEPVSRDVKQTALPASTAVVQTVDPKWRDDPKVAAVIEAAVAKHAPILPAENPTPTASALPGLKSRAAELAGALGYAAPFKARFGKILGKPIETLANLTEADWEALVTLMSAGVASREAAMLAWDRWARAFDYDPMNSEARLQQFSSVTGRELSTLNDLLPLEWNVAATAFTEQADSFEHAAAPVADASAEIDPFEED